MILSVENFTSWSWSGIFTKMIPHLKYPIMRVVRGSDLDEICIPRAIKGVLLQNVDSLSLLEKTDAKTVLCRIGGIGLQAETDILKGTKWDKPLSRVGAVIATNPLLAVYGAQCNENTFMIPNGVDLEAFKPLEHKIPSAKFRVGFVGNITSSYYLNYKGFQYIAGACNELFDSVEMVVALYKSKQLAHDRMVPDFYHKVDCVVNMSIGEGCSNTIMEALACGVPVICTKVGFHGARLIDGFNVLFIQRDVSALKAAICKLKDNPHLCRVFSKHARAFAEKFHDIRDIARQYNDVFQHVLNKEK